MHPIHPQEHTLPEPHRAFLGALDAAMEAMDASMRALPPSMIATLKRGRDHAMYGVIEKGEVWQSAHTRPSRRPGLHAAKSGPDGRPRLTLDLYAPYKNTLTSHAQLALVPTALRLFDEASAAVQKVAAAWDAIPGMGNLRLVIYAYPRPQGKGPRIHITLRGTPFAFGPNKGLKAIDWDAQDGTRWRIVGFLARIADLDATPLHTWFVSLSSSRLEQTAKDGSYYFGSNVLYAADARSAAGLAAAFEWLGQEHDDRWKPFQPVVVAQVCTITL